MSFKSLLTHSVYIQTKSTTTNAWNEPIETWTSPSTTTKCRMSPIRDEVRMQSAGRLENVDYEAFFDYDTTITVDNRVLWGSETFAVRDVTTDSINFCKKALLEKVQGPGRLIQTRP